VQLPENFSRRNDTRRCTAKLGGKRSSTWTQKTFDVPRGTGLLREPVCENPPPRAQPMISLARYATLLAIPELRGALLASLIGRMPVGITGLAVLLLVQSSSGSFVRAGAATACYIAGLAALSPILGRLIDRQGPRQILLVCSVLNPLSLAALVLLIESSAPAWAWLPLAATAGASFPPITVCMRTLFRQRLGDDPLLATAYSLESVLIEAIFIVGPMLVAFFVAVASPSLAVLFAATCGATGAQLFLRSPALRKWKIDPHPSSNLLGPLSAPRFGSLLAVVLCYSVAFGLVEIGVTGFAAEAGSPALAGVLLGLMSVGSAVGGLAYGSRSWHMPLARQFSLTLALMGCGILPLAFLTGVWGFAGFALLGGIVMAPALTMQSMLVAKTASSESSTEAFTWSATGLLAGIGLGFAAGGVILQTAGSAAVFIAAATASLLGAGGAHLGLRYKTKLSQ
jgi:predicted MFS family arabinose efflux permease